MKRPTGDDVVLWVWRLRWLLLLLLLAVIVVSNVLYYGDLLPWIVRGGR